MKKHENVQKRRQVDSCVMVVLVGAALGGMMFWSQMTGGEFVVQPGSLEWSQPSEANTSYSQAIAPDNWDVDFEMIERALLPLALAPGEPLPLNPELIPVMASIIEQLPESITDQQLLHINMLFDRTLPGGTGNTLASLIKHYRECINAHEQLELSYQDLPPKDLKEAESRYLAEIKLKEQYLGKEVTEKLFGEQHRFALYVFARHKVISDASVPSKQVAIVLKLMQKDFFKGIPKRS